MCAVAFGAESGGVYYVVGVVACRARAIGPRLSESSLRWLTDPSQSGVHAVRSVCSARERSLLLTPRRVLEHLAQLTIVGPNLAQRDG